MTVLVRPQALDDFKVREFQMLIDGRWTEARKADVIERRSSRPWRRRVSRYQAANQGRCRARNRRRPQRVRQWSMAAHDRRRAIAHPSEGRRPHRCALRRTRLSRLHRIRQADHARPRAKSAAPSISGAMPRHLARDLHGESYNTLGDGNAGRRAARGDRRRLDHHAMEFPVPDRQPEAALRACRRLHRRRQAIGTDIRLDAGARRNPDGSRRSGWRRQHHRRHRRRGRRRR